MWVKHNKILLSKILLLLVMLLVVMSGLSGLGCMKGLQPIGWSGGAVVDGTLFVGSTEGRLVAINIADGARQWSESLKTPGSAGWCGCAVAPAGMAIYGTPAVAGDLVYIGGYNGKIYAFNSSSLQKRWVYPPEGNLKPIVGGPMVALGRVYFGCSDGKVYALDAATGDKQWEFKTGDKIWSTPAIDGDTLFVASFDNKLYALNTTNGEERWQKPFETEGAIASTPLVYNNTVYIGSFDRHIYAVDATDGSLVWKSEVEGGNWFWAKPVAYNNVIYAPCLDGKVYILDAESGREVVDAIDLESPVSSSPVLVGSSIIIALEDGQIYAIDTANNQIKLLANVEERIDAPLCASQGIVYVHTQDLTIHPVDTNTGARLMSISLKASQ